MKSTRRQESACAVGASRMIGFSVIVVAVDAISLGRRVSNWQANSCNQRLLRTIRMPCSFQLASVYPSEPFASHARSRKQLTAKPRANRQTVHGIHEVTG